MKRGNNFQQVGFEFLSIVVAVILAMALTEWRQDVLNRKQAEVSFQNILQEIGENIDELQNDSSALAEDVEEMGRWLEVDRQHRDTMAMDISFDYSFLTTAAWEVAQMNQSLTFLENQKVQDLAQVYEAQEFYENTGTKVFDLMSGFATSGESNSMEYQNAVTALRFKMRLTYASVVTYLGVAKAVRKRYLTTSDSTD